GNLPSRDGDAPWQDRGTRSHAGCLCCAVQRLYQGPAGGHSRAANKIKESAMRIAIAGFMQETNSFVPFTTTVKTFEDQYLYRGDEILTAYGRARLEIPAALDVLKEAGATPVPLLATMAMASGTVERKSFDIIMGEIEDRLQAAGPVDGVFLAL